MISILDWSNSSLSSLSMGECKRGQHLSSSIADYAIAVRCSHLEGDISQ